MQHQNLTFYIFWTNAKVTAFLLCENLHKKYWDKKNGISTRSGICFRKFPRNPERRAGGYIKKHYFIQFDFYKKVNKLIVAVAIYSVQHNRIIFKKGFLSKNRKNKFKCRPSWRRQLDRLRIRLCQVDRVNWPIPPLLFRTMVLHQMTWTPFFTDPTWFFLLRILGYF